MIDKKSSPLKHDIEKAPKTGKWSFMRPQVDEEKCIGCTTCTQFCPEACMEMIDKSDANFWGQEQNDQKKKIKKISQVDYAYCKGCGVCAQVCPVKAILMKEN